MKMFVTACFPFYMFAQNSDPEFVGVLLWAAAILFVFHFNN